MTSSKAVNKSLGSWYNQSCKPNIDKGDTYVHKYRIAFISFLVIIFSLKQ